MKKPSNISWLWRGAVMSVLLAALGASTSCMTTYDAYGYPVQSVDPAVAVAGVAAAGLVGYAVANNNNHYHGGYYGGGYRYYGGGGYYRPRPYYRGGYNGYHGYRR